jgi:replicative DNA helicase
MTTISPPQKSKAEQSGRVPPHDIDAEMAVLGAMMLDRDAIGNVLPVLNRDDAGYFYRPEHERLFVLLVDLYDANKEIDLVTVQDELQRRELLEQVGGVPYLVHLAESVPSITNAEHYARIVRDKGVLRDLIRCSDEISQIAYDDKEPTEDLLDAAERKFFAVTERRISRHASQLRELLASLYEQVEQRRERHLSGLPTGFTELDDLTTGLQRGDFIIVAGRPSMGKTALGLTMCEHLAANENMPVAFFSMEMSNQQVAQRILCSRGKIDSHQFRKGMVGEDEIERLGYVCEELANIPFYVDDTPGMSILELRAKARRLARQYDIKAVFVDYIQLMRVAGAETRQQEISAISAGLKALGRELNIPIVALAQLNRQSEGREGHRPRMSDLRESGALEQDADVILLIHREEYYKPQSLDAQGIAEVIIAKQRNGPTEVVKLHFNKRLTRFDNLSLVPEPGGYEQAADVPF